MCSSDNSIIGCGGVSCRRSLDVSVFERCHTGPSVDETWGSWVGVRKDTKTHSQSWCFKSSSRSNGGLQWSVAYPQWLVLINNNNYPLSKYISVLIFVGMAAVLLTLSSIERPYKHENFNVSVLRQGFKNYSHYKRFSCLSSLLKVKSSLAKKI